MAVVLAQLLDLAHTVRQFTQQGNLLIERRMGIRLAREDKVTVLGQEVFTKRLVAVQIVAQQGQLTGGTLAGVTAHPACGGRQFTVLFLRTILWRHELRCEHYNARIARAHQRRPHQAVAVMHLPVERPRAAVRTVNLRRTEVLRAIQRPQVAPR